MLHLYVFIYFTLTLFGLVEIKKNISYEHRCIASKLIQYSPNFRIALYNSVSWFIRTSTFFLFLRLSCLSFLSLILFSTLSFLFHSLPFLFLMHLMLPDTFFNTGIHPLHPSSSHLVPFMLLSLINIYFK